MHQNGVRTLTIKKEERSLTVRERVVQLRFRVIEAVRGPVEKNVVSIASDRQAQRRGLRTYRVDEGLGNLGPVSTGQYHSLEIGIGSLSHGTPFQPADSCLSLPLHVCTQDRPHQTDISPIKERIAFSRYLGYTSI